jgi:hypothetical protein
LLAAGGTPLIGADLATFLKAQAAIDVDPHGRGSENANSITCLASCARGHERHHSPYALLTELVQGDKYGLEPAASHAV